MTWIAHATGRVLSTAALVVVVAAAALGALGPLCAQQADQPVTRYGKAEDFRVITLNDLGISFRLPRSWTDIDSDALSNLNKVARDAKSRVIYVAGFQKLSPAEQRPGFAPFIFVSKIPGRTTATKLLADSPNMKIRPEAAKALADGGVQATFGQAYLDEKLKMVILSVRGSREWGGELVGRTYCIPTKPNLVSIVVYCKPEVAKTILAEVELSLATLQLSDKAKLPENWVDELKLLLKRRS